MARPLRLEFPGACYHVINRGNIRFPVFREVRDRELILEKPVDQRFQVCIRGYGALIGSTRSLTVAALFGRIRGYGALIGVPFRSGSPVGCERKELLRRYKRGLEARQVFTVVDATAWASGRMDWET